MSEKKIAFVFPGQGSQSVGMLSTLKDEPIVQQTLEEAIEVLGFDLAKLIAEGPTEELSLTVNTQPALVTASTAMYRYYLSKGGRRPDVAAGHSLGEYSALVAAGALEFKDAVKLVRFRAEKMQEAVPVGEGTMAAVLGLDDDKVKSVCLECAANGVVEAVNFNTPGQVVIAGTVAAVEAAMSKSLEAGAKRAIRLNVSGPFHSSLMKPAAIAMEERLRTVELRSPEIPVLHNVDVRLRSEADDIRGALSAQVSSAVLWADTVREMEKMGCTELYEVGPGAALTGMTKRITKGIAAKALNSKEALEEAASNNQE